MSLAAPRTDTATGLIALMEAARSAADALLHDATIKVRERLSRDGRIDASLVEREQRAAHGLAWFATYAQAIRQLASYTQTMGQKELPTSGERMRRFAGSCQYA